MNDVEHDLRELFERKASSVGGVAPRLPETVRKRGRRRQLGTAFVGGLTALAVLAGTVGVIRAVDTDRDRQPTPADDPWAGYEVFERTATVGNFTITSPSDWYLVNQWPWARTALLLGWSAEAAARASSTPTALIAERRRSTVVRPMLDTTWSRELPASPSPPGEAP